MKTNVNTHGGQLAPASEDAYARYLTRAVAEYRAAGAPVTALTVVNEPKASPGYSPSMAMSRRPAGPAGRDVAAARARRGRAALGGRPGLRPQLGRHGVPDGGADRPVRRRVRRRGLPLLRRRRVGPVRVAAAAPGKQVWTTECSGGAWSPDFPTNLRWNARHMVVGAFRNLSTASLWFNLALDPSGGPTNGGCTDLPRRAHHRPGHRGGHPQRRVLAAGPVRPGRQARRRAGRLHGVEPDRRAVGGVRQPGRVAALVLYNEGGSAQPVTVRWAGKVARVRVPPGPSPPSAGECRPWRRARSRRAVRRRPATSGVAGRSCSFGGREGTRTPDLSRVKRAL